MVTDEYEWSPRPPNTRERVVAALLVAALAVTGASTYAGWRLFGDYDKVVAGITIVCLIVFTRLMPTARRRR